MKKSTIVYIATITLSIVYIFVFNRIASGEGSLFVTEQEGATIRAKVLRIVENETITFPSEDDDRASVTVVHFEAKALNGQYKNQTILAVQELDHTFALSSVPVTEGSSILLDEFEEEGETVFYFSDYQRMTPLLILGIVFIGLLILFGRKKGVNTVISLVFTCLAVFVVLLPAILNGHDIYGWSIMTCAYITVMTVLLINGINSKSIAAGIGCISGVLVAGLIVVIMNSSLKLTGLLEEDSVYLLMLNTENPINLKAIIFAMIIVGAVGAVMDVAMSIASSLYEIKQNSPEISNRELIQSGFRIGQDMMGTMANTLVLAYIGSSLTSVLLLFAYNSNVTQILNREMIAAEILQAIAGSLGILAALPLTTVVSVALYNGVRGKELLRKDD